MEKAKRLIVSYAVAERLFREIGYQKTTVADIAKVLRMSPACPMMVLAVRIEHPLDMTVQRAHDPDTREHRRAA